MASSRIDGDLVVTGSISSNNNTPSDSTVTNAKVASGAAIAFDKLEHWIKAGTNFALAEGGTPVAREEIVYVASNSGTVTAFKGLLDETGTSTDISFILKKNGSSILSANAQVQDSDGDRSVQSGTLSSTSFVAGDVFSIELTVTSSTGAEGPFAWMEAKEVGV